MRFTLFPFQEDALDGLQKRIKAANAMLQDGTEQVVISFSAPTGSGKTIVMAELFENILRGTADFDSQPNAIILWLSDMPELNEQSRLKIEGKSDKIRVSDLHTIDSNFDMEYLESGNIYFLNTQKLGNDKLLTQKSDARQYTIWETLTNTAKEYKGRFYLVIDEAHRGTNLSSREEKAAQSIMQKFILGSDEDGLCKMPLIIGMTATPQRFHDLIKNTNSTEFKIAIKPEDVRSSGLLKDRVIIHYPEADHTPEMTMFRGAVESWKKKAAQWEKYCASQKEKLVKPVMVIQVEDVKDGAISATDLAECLSLLEDCLNRPLRDGEIVHCLDNKKTQEIGRWKIPSIEPSRIEEKEKVNFVIFKMSLSTGWDCPRAEVMMSFRGARDFTYIAQLLGRMVRTPLARRISTDDELNDVRLFLPHYDETTVKDVVRALNSGDDIIPADTQTAGESVTYYRNDLFKDVFEAMSGLITYRIDSSRKIQPLRRLMKFCRAVTFDSIDETAYSNLKNAIVEKISEVIKRFKLKGRYDEIAQTITGFDLKTLTFNYADKAYRIDDAGMMVVEDLDIGRYFEAANKRLGDGLGMEYWIAKHGFNEDTPDDEARIDVIVFAGSNEAMEALNQYARDEFSRLYEKYRRFIALLPDKRRKDYEAIAGAADAPLDVDWIMPDSVNFTLNTDCADYRNHLYVSTDGSFKTYLNAWERELILEELKNGAYAWLRNLDRKSWSLEIPYQDGDTIRPMYPDMLVVNKTGGEFKFSILEPHDPSRTDNVKKAKGLAEFAEKHHSVYDRIQLIRKRIGADRREHLYRLDMSRLEVRNKVKGISSDNELDALFETDARTDV
jgi:type III restriction enzyme